jgi:protein-S-isoprenylcysteine O-methyltransferase Ste14
VTALAVIIIAQPALVSLLAGGTICCLGLVFRGWASGHLRKEKELTVSGPYRYTRNPLYFGNLIIGIGVVVAAHSWWVAGIVVVYFLLFYPVIIRVEIERMKRLFPEKYRDYSQRASLFWPALKSSLPLSHRFSWNLYKKNKEYRALVGALAFWVLLAIRLILFS